jgi:molybdopterin converting factor small subunit
MGLPDAWPATHPAGGRRLHRENDPPSMKILFFAQAQRLVGTALTEWNLDQPIDIDTFWKRLLHEHPQLTPLKPTLRLAKNLEFTVADTLFSDGDEAAVIPPVSGG